jgi:hypothetical protein
MKNKDYKPFIDYSRFEIKIRKKENKDWDIFDEVPYEAKDNPVLQASLYLDNKLRVKSFLQIKEIHALNDLMNRTVEYFGFCFCGEALNYIKITREYEEDEKKL